MVKRVTSSGDSNSEETARGAHTSLLSTMKLLSWKCQGLGNSWTVQSLHNLMRDQIPTVCFLMETRLDKEGFKKHGRELPFPNKFIVKKPYSGGG